ncbi:SDR family oxidoreductase [Botrimarina sp.]|uniref:SDR family NAD(P)-dependent oxidoreductase n=1 Tax=Botrimarina sp. TaxID=2795802 RepID=UPI0032EF24A3
MGEAQAVAVVTGAAGGIGGAFALRLASLGYAVVAVDSDRAGLAELMSGPLGGGGHRSLGADVSDPAAWDRVADECRRGAARVDLLVQAAGVLLVGPLERCDAADVRRVIDVNLTGAALGARAIAPLLRETARRHGAPPALPRGLLNVASVFATVAPPGFAVYNASKAGLLVLTESLRGELAADRLAATAVLPGVTPTGLFAKAIYSDAGLRAATEDWLERSELTPDEVAEAALRAYRRGRAAAVIGRRARRFALLKALAPGLTRRRVAAAAGRFLSGG